MRSLEWPKDVECSNKKGNNVLQNLKKSGLLFLTAFVITAAGCSTIVNGRNESVTFQSTPSGANVAINGAVIGVTPLTTMLPKKSGQTLTMSKPGYKTFSTSMTTTVNGWFFGNIVLGGLLGSTTDAATGSMYEYSPKQFLVSLEPDTTSKVDAPVEKGKKDKAREFIILSYTPLMSDLAKGSGNYLKSLLKMLEVPASDEAAAVKRMKAMSEAFPDMAQFADEVSSAFVKQDVAASHP